MTIDDIMRAAPVIPVLVFHEEMDWVALAETFVGAGLPVLEVTLRTGYGLEAIRQMSKVPGAMVGAGTVLDDNQLAQAIEAGSGFIVSPGLTGTLGRAAIKAAFHSCPASRLQATSCVGLILDWTDLNSFLPRHREGFPR